LLTDPCLRVRVPPQVKPDSSVAQRSAASGRLVLVMPKEEPEQPVVDVAYLRSVAGRSVMCAQHRGNTCADRLWRRLLRCRPSNNAADQAGGNLASKGVAGAAAPISLKGRQKVPAPSRQQQQPAVKQQELLRAVPKAAVVVAADSSWEEDCEDIPGLTG
jgi:hypothetical protein